jgi:putative FmdB family regulatory protein
MPFYEYECQACKFYTEVMQKISDAPLTRCPSCGKRRLKKLLSAPVFRLKGSGWYETDFKSDKEGKRNLVGADKEEAKAESKPELKPEAKEGKPEAKDAKAADTKAADTKAADTKAADTEAPASKPAAAKSASGGRRPVKGAKARSTRRRRR